MDFYAVLDQVVELLQQRGRVTYRALKRQFGLDEESLADLKEELIKATQVARDENNEVLVWIGANSPESSVQRLESKAQKRVVPSQTLDPRLTDSRLDAAERRQLTVMFCDLVDSTALSAQLDPEEYREVVRSYQHTSAEIIDRYAGHIAQYLGDGLLVYFGYPVAHEDDAARAVRAGLGIISALQSVSSRQQVPSPFRGEGQGEGGAIADGGMPSAEEKSQNSLPAIPQSAFAIPQLKVRIGIHTGLVVVGEMGGGNRHEQLALGETPNLAARIQGLAEPNTVIISAATQRLIEGQFESQPFGSHRLKGITTPIAVYHVQSERQNVSPLAGRTTLTPLVGREQEVGLLIDRWEQVKEGRGQAVLLSGEPGIGKSRLAYTLREHVTDEGSLLFEARCSPYHQQSALYPLIEVLQRTLLFTRQDTDAEKVTKLERVLALYELQPVVSLFTALLSLPTPSAYPPLTFTPQKQKERTLEALLQLLGAQAERQATVSVWEDVHWADPSSLEFLSLLIEQLPTSKLLLVLTFRPEFTPPWKPRSHISQLVLNRLGRKQVEVMIEKAAAGQALAVEVIEQIRLKTDGVPLFVEELTKSVIEAVGGQGPGVGGREGKAGTTLPIPATLQEALLARLDRLSEARQVAQLGATLGREFSYELLQAVTPLQKTDLHEALSKLVEAEILYQRGIGEQARYFFKHALIQDTAYQSLLKSTRQQYHTRIAQVLEERFAAMTESQPELLAHHYTEANLLAQAIPYWQHAGQSAVQRSANVEAVSHLTKGLELLMTLPDTPERAQQELTLQVALGSTLIAAKGHAAPEVEHTFARAHALCFQVDDTLQLAPTLGGLWAFYHMRAELETACALGKQLLALTQRVQDSVLLMEAHKALGASLAFRGEMIEGRAHLEHAVAIAQVQPAPSVALFHADPRVDSRAHLARVLWVLGYPEQARQRSQEAFTLAQEMGHPGSLAVAIAFAGWVYQLRREGQMLREHAEAVMNLGAEHELPFHTAWGTLLRGAALAEQGEVMEGMTQIREGWSALRDSGTRLNWSYSLGLLAEAYGKVGQTEEGLAQLREAFEGIDESGGRWYEAELYRLKGELTLQSQTSLGQVQGKSQTSQNKSQASQDQSENTDPRPLAPDPQAEAEACFHKAIEIAQRQQAKSLELRAVMSLARLWQSQGKRAEAHQMLSEVYNWFTEGFDTKDLQEAKALLEELSH